jgi:putative membrane protein
MSQPSTMGAERPAAMRDVAAPIESRMTMSTMQPGLAAAPPPEEDGHEPDYRFTLANERTFLAWIRTALALLAGSVAIVQLVPHFASPDARKAIGGLLAVISIAMVAHSIWRWHSVQQAMRRDAPLPPSRTIWLLSGAIVLIGGFVLLLVLAFGIGND